MNHKTEKFLFADNTQKQVAFTTKKWCFELEKMFIEMIGREKYEQYQKDKTIDLDLTLAKVETYFPLLLIPPTEKFNWKKINWAKQDFDTILSVVTFFLQYKKNATLRRLTSEKETVASIIQAIQNLSALELKTIFNRSSLENTPDTSLQEKTLEKQNT